MTDDQITLAQLTLVATVATPIAAAVVGLGRMLLRRRRRNKKTVTWHVARTNGGSSGIVEVTNTGDATAYDVELVPVADDTPTRWNPRDIKSTVGPGESHGRFALSNRSAKEVVISYRPKARGKKVREVVPKPPRLPR